MTFPDGTVKEGRFENNIYLGTITEVNETSLITEEREGESPAGMSQNNSVVMVIGSKV
jgi:hypothetical protein